MDTDDEITVPRKCYKCDYQILNNLHVVYNPSNSTVVLWNKYQIFIYEGFELDSPLKIIAPEFQLHRVTASNNYLVCLDCSGNVHLVSLKFKRAAQKHFKASFQPKEQGIKSSISYKEDNILCLKYDSGTYFLCLNRINADFQIEKKIIIICDYEHCIWKENEKQTYLLTTHSVNTENETQLKKLFKTDQNLRNYNIVLISFDNITVYACLFSPTMLEDELALIKLYSCPAEICNVEIVNVEELYVVISLTIGTVIRLSFKDSSKAPDIIHLNTALHKVMTLKDCFIYTDGITMWKSEDTFTDDLKFTQFFVQDVHDFEKCGDQIICSTFTKLIYAFSIEDKDAYVKPPKDHEYCPAEKLLNNSECLNKIFEEIDRNNEIVKKLSAEDNLITALSLSNRQDVMDRALETSVIVFENYEEAINEQFILTDNLSQYFEADTWLLHIKLAATNISNTLSSILANLIGDTKIHITISTNKKILKTTNFNIEEPIKLLQLMIPVQQKQFVTYINVNIKIVLNVPGALDKKHAVWTVLYRKDVILNSEHFIKTDSENKRICLKTPKESIDDTIHKGNLLNYGSLFQFTDVSMFKSEREWSFYVKLPENYDHVFINNDYCKMQLSERKFNFLKQQLTSEDFLVSKNKNSLLLSINNKQIKVEIQNDGFSNPILKVSSENVKLALNIRNFLSKMIYNGYRNNEPGKEFISSTFYTTAENIQIATKTCITSSACFEEFLPLMDQFERNVIGALPI